MGSTTLIISAIMSLVMLLVFSFWEDFKFYIKNIEIKVESFAVLKSTTFYKHIRRRTSSSHEQSLLPALIVMTSLIRDKGILEATVIGSFIFFLLTLSDTVWIS